MRLLEEMKAVCKALVDTGWHTFLLRISDLDLSTYNSPNLKKELLRPLKIDRGAPGMADFAAEGVRAIEPGMPAHSFLFHVLASPAIVPREVTGFPTLEMLETVENFIHGVEPPSIADLRQRCGNAPLALVVFTSEYRAGIATVHQIHADMCYSRTGIARIGTSAPRYSPAARGYTSLGQDPKAVHVIPGRYSVYIAARMRGNFQSFGPMRPRRAVSAKDYGQTDQLKSMDTAGNPVEPDDLRFFWVPLHKVFSGTECVRGLDLKLTFKTHHQNEKLRRLCLYMESRGLPVMNTGQVLDQFPFLISEDRLARIMPVGSSSIQVAPIPQPLAEEARLNGARIEFAVPSGGGGGGGAFRIPCRPGGGRPAPEYIYVRQAISDRGKPLNLNRRHRLIQKVDRGGFKSQLYIDYCGDGWVAAHCEGLALDLPRSLAAYSVLAPPDPYPAVKQQDIYDWWLQSAPPEIKKSLFPDFEGPLPMEPLSDTRLTANINYRHRITPMKDEPIFDSADDSYTAIISGLNSGRGRQQSIQTFDDGRISVLPDGASGLFAPGWDISMDQHDDENKPGGVLHLSGYGGSVPFLEDVRLCAAQSAFWPAVAPDTSRLYEPGHYPSVTPIPDSRLGWDGLGAPQMLRRRTPRSPGVVRFYSLSHTDYIQQAGGPGLDFHSIGSVTFTEYKLWSLLMARVYGAIGCSSTQEKMRWALVSFDEARPGDPDLAAAQIATGLALSAPYHFFLILPCAITPAKDPLFVHASFDRCVVAFAAPDHVLYRDTDKRGWARRDF